MKRIGIFLIISVMLLCFSFCICGCSKSEELDNDKIEKEIIYNMEKILEVTDTTSSNPYDYTKNEYYKNIVNIGEPAINSLESMFKDGTLTGVSAYLSALLIQDITGCNLVKEYNLDWSTASEFYDLWKDHNCSYK